MGVGKAILGSQGPSSIVWSENRPCCGTNAYFVGWKEGRIWLNTICVKIDQFEIIIWWCLFVLEFVMQYVMKYVLKFVLLEISLGPPLGGGSDKKSGRPWNIIYSPPCRTPCRLSIHEVFFGPLGLYLRVWSELGRSLPFRPMRALRLQWSWAFSLVWEVALSPHFTHKPRAVTMKSWEPKRKCPKAVPRHFQNCVVWSWARDCSVKSYVTRPSSTNCHFNEFLFMLGPYTW